MIAPSPSADFRREVAFLLCYFFNKDFGGVPGIILLVSSLIAIRAVVLVGIISGSISFLFFLLSTSVVLLISKWALITHLVLGAIFAATCILIVYLCIEFCTDFWHNYLSMQGCRWHLSYSSFAWDFKNIIRNFFFHTSVFYPVLYIIKRCRYLIVRFDANTIGKHFLFVICMRVNVTLPMLW